MDNYVNTNIGIYYVESLCDNKATDGHKLYHVKCRYCEFESDMRLSDIKYPQVCKHKSKAGRIINFRPLWENQRLGRIYNEMISRCYDCNNKAYRWYGQKGIKVCEEWINSPRKFIEWALNNSYDDSLTIDRMDENKDYEPNNCRWIPLEENSRRAGRVNWLTVNNETLTGRQWAERLGLGLSTIDKYIRLYGYDPTKQLISAILQEPLFTKKRKPRQTWLDVYNITI